MSLYAQPLIYCNECGGVLEVLKRGQYNLTAEHHKTPGCADGGKTFQIELPILVANEVLHQDGSGSR